MGLVAADQSESFRLLPWHRPRIAVNVMAGSQINQANLVIRNPEIILDSVDACIYTKDPKGRYTFANKRVCELFQASLQDILGKTDRDFLDVEKGSRIESSDELVLMHGQRVEGRDTEVVASTSGAARTYWTVKVPLYATDGSIEGLCGVSTDITEREALRKRFNQEHELLTLVLDNVAAHIYMKDHAGRYLYANPPVTALFQRPLSSILGLTDLEIFGEEIAAQLTLVDARVLVDKERFKVNETVEVVKGDKHYFVSTKVPVEREGLPTSLIGFSTEITELVLIHESVVFRSRILEMMASGKPIDAILLAVVTGIETLHPDMVCSILLLEDGGKQLGQCVAPSLPDFYNAAINGIEVQLGNGSCGTAAFTGERVIVSDILTHPYWERFKELAARAGLAACWSQPIYSSTHKMLGTFAMYHRRIHTPDERDITLIEEAAQLVGIALEKNMVDVQVRNFAFYDSLTQLANRRLLSDRLTMALATGQRSGQHGAVMVLDLDNFKPLNDEHGHEAGDLLLIEVAQRLKASVREVDTVARIGGDEFVVVVNNLGLDADTAQQQAMNIAQTLRLSVAGPYALALQPEHRADTLLVEHRCTASIGVTLFQDGKVGQDEILKRADLAMYRAKDAGRNTICFSDNTTGLT